MRSHASRGAFWALLGGAVIALSAANGLTLAACDPGFEPESGCPEADGWTPAQDDCLAQEPDHFDNGPVEGDDFATVDNPWTEQAETDGVVSEDGTVEDQAAGQEEASHYTYRYEYPEEQGTVEGGTDWESRYAEEYYYKYGYQYAMPDGRYGGDTGTSPDAGAQPGEPAEGAASNESDDAQSDPPVQDLCHSGGGADAEQQTEPAAGESGQQAAGPTSECDYGRWGYYGDGEHPYGYDSDYRYESRYGVESQYNEEPSNNDGQPSSADEQPEQYDYGTWSYEDEFGHGMAGQEETGDETGEQGMGQSDNGDGEQTDDSADEYEHECFDEGGEMTDDDAATDTGEAAEEQTYDSADEYEHECFDEGGEMTDEAGDEAAVEAQPESEAQPQQPETQPTEPPQAYRSEYDDQSEYGYDSEYGRESDYGYNPEYDYPTGDEYGSEYGRYGYHGEGWYEYAEPEGSTAVESPEWQAAPSQTAAEAEQDEAASGDEPPDADVRHFDEVSRERDWEAEVAAQWAASEYLGYSPAYPEEQYAYPDQAGQPSTAVDEAAGAWSGNDDEFWTNIEDRYEGEPGETTDPATEPVEPSSQAEAAPSSDAAQEAESSEDETGAADVKSYGYDYADPYQYYGYDYYADELERNGTSGCPGEAASQSPAPESESPAPAPEPPAAMPETPAPASETPTAEDSRPGGLELFAWHPSQLLVLSDQDLLRTLESLCDEPSGVRRTTFSDYLESLGLEAGSFADRFEEASGVEMLALADDLPGAAAFLGTYRLVEQGELGVDEAVDLLQRSLDNLSLDWIEGVNEITAGAYTSIEDQAAPSPQPVDEDAESDAETTNPYGEAIDPYGEGIDPYRESVNPYGEGIDPYGESADPYGEGIDPYGESVDPYGEGMDPYGESQQPAVPEATDATTVSPVLEAMLASTARLASGVGGPIWDVSGQLAALGQQGCEAQPSP